MAQSPTDRAALAALTDTLSRIESPAALHDLQSAPIRPRDKAVARLRTGLMHLAAARIEGGRGHLDDALMEFDWAVTMEPRWPWPRFGRAMAKLALSDGGFTVKFTAGQPWGVNYYQGFVPDMLAAFERDSAFEPGIRYLVAVLPPQGDRTQPDGFVRALAIRGRDADAPADLHLVLGRAYRTSGRFDASTVELDAYLRAGGDSGLAFLETARTLADAGRLRDAAASYLRGAVRGDGVARRVYRRDLAWIASDGELAAFDSLPAVGLGAWIAGFWARRDAEAVRPPGERLREHLRRWAHAHRHFRVRSPERRTDFEKVMLADIGPCMPAGEKSLDNLSFEDPARLDDARRRERLLDHRGVVYIRHGEPAHVVTALNFVPHSDRPAVAAGISTTRGQADAPAVDLGYLSDAVDPAEGFEAQVWHYWFDGESRLLYFAGSLPLGDGPTTLYPYVPFTPSLLYKVAAIDARYLAVANAAQRRADGMRSRNAPPLACMKAVQHVRRDSRRAMVASVESDSHTLLFREPLAATLQTFAVGDAAAGTGRVLVTFAAPGNRLIGYPRDDGERGLLYPLTIRVTAVDSAGRVAWNADTTRTFHVADTLRAGEHLTGLIEVPLPAGRFDVRVAAFQPEGRAGAAIERRAVSLEGAGLGLSDIVTGDERGGVVWASGAEPVSINALDAYPAGATAPIYYEVRGLEAGRRYRTTVTVQRGAAGGGRAVRLLFEEEAAGPAARMRRDVSLAQLSPGRYRLTVTVEDIVTNRSVTRERLITLLPAVR